MASAPCASPTSTAFQLYCIDGDSDGFCTVDGEGDMLIQAAGFNGNGGAMPAPNLGYRLGIRVYQAFAFESGGTLDTNPVGNQGLVLDPQRPLVQLTTEIDAAQDNYNNLCFRLDPVNGCN
ncbi:MAG: hypothetical protein HC890_03865 [Chloroflexaceae bacterium]|nr:hypothetical protein [Chloroflexaceae bacterium]